MSKKKRKDSPYTSIYDPNYSKGKIMSSEKRMGKGILRFDPGDRELEIDFEELFGREELSNQQKYYSRLVADHFDLYKGPAEPLRGPPESYTKAKEAVKAYLMIAPQQAFDDIVGNQEALEQLKDAIEGPIKYPELYETYGMKPPKGALLCGPPGCGKTMFARAAACEIKRLYGGTGEFLMIAATSIQSYWAGHTEERIRALFTFAREYKKYHGHPLLIFIDEAEVMLPDRTNPNIYSYKESNVATFLTEMDGIQESGAFVLLATNRPEALDQALLREGRCDFKINIQAPDRKSVEIILTRQFTGIFTKEKIEDLVFAAIESLYDPHKILLEAHAIRINWKEEKIDLKDKHFLLEHIISGALVTDIPEKAKLVAFNRDKADGKASGITTQDVVKAVNMVYEQNKTMNHSFALAKFQQTFLDELNAQELANQRNSDKGLN